MAYMTEIIDLIENFDKIKKVWRNLWRRLEYSLFWSKEDKETSEELIKKYQLPKNTFGIKEVIIVKDIKIKRRHEE